MIKKFKLEEDIMFDCDLDCAISKLQRFKEDFSEYHDLFIEPSYRWEGDNTYELYGHREETKKEKERRLKEEKELEQRRKAQLIRDAKKLGLKVEE